MRGFVRWCVVAAVLLRAGECGAFDPPPQPPQYATMERAMVGPQAQLNSSIPFPKTNPWNVSVAGAPVDPNSAKLIASIGLDTGLHPDFGAGTYAGSILGIPYAVVNGSQEPVAIHFSLYGDESDKGPYPIPPDARIEGYKPGGGSFGGDRHLIVIDRDRNRLYELYNASKRADGSWNANCGAVFHLDSDDVRPTAHPGWTSADAAGLPIFPGLVRYDEASSGMIAHALRFTVAHSRRAYLPPATHYASSDTSANLPPMGMRVRLKASYVIPSSFSKPTQAILYALQRYGMFVADNGSNWYLSGSPDPNWDNDRLVSELRQVKGKDFEVVKMTGLVTQ